MIHLHDRGTLRIDDDLASGTIEEKALLIAIGKDRQNGALIRDNVRMRLRVGASVVPIGRRHSRKRKWPISLIVGENRFADSEDDIVFGTDQRNVGMTPGGCRRIGEGEQIRACRNHFACVNRHPLAAVGGQQAIAHLPVSLLIGQEISVKSLALVVREVRRLKR